MTDYDFNRKLDKIIREMVYSWKAQGFYIGRLEQGRRSIQSLFIREGWTPPPEKDEKPDDSATLNSTN